MKENGQRICDYYVSTLMMDRAQPFSKTGLCLHGGVPNWDIDGGTMKGVMEWLEGAVAA